MTIRVPPHNDDAERSVLGAVMLNQRVLDEIQGQLTPEDFYREPHRHIFRAMVDMHGRGEPIDPVTLSDYLSASNLLQSTGGPDELNKLIGLVPSTANVNHYATIVRRKAVIRGLIDAAASLVEEGYQDVPDIQVFLDDAERRIFDVTQRGVSKGYSTMREVIRETIIQMEALASESKSVTGVPSGFVDLDKITAGWQPSDLIIMAARPAMGKTSFTLNMLTHAAIERKLPAVFFSLEMSNSQLAIRMLCSEARVDQTRLRRGRLTEPEWGRLIKAAANLSNAPIYLDDTPALSIMEFRSKCRRMKSEHDLGIIFIDYLQLMRGTQSRSGSREQEISEISRNLKAVAKELNIPIIALAQLNRGVEQRADKRPMMSDLRESGAIEQDADIIAFIYRDEVYNPDTERKGIAEIILGKHRNGALGNIDLRFFGMYTRFENLAQAD